MKKSISAKVMTEMFHLWPKSTAEERLKKYKEAIEKGAKQTPAPGNIVTRYEDHENGGIFYANEKGVSRYTVFYIHGGYYVYQMGSEQMATMNRIANQTNAMIVMPIYRLAPFTILGLERDVKRPLSQFQVSSFKFHVPSSIGGRIDRLDLINDEYIRVVDYKTGSKRLKPLADVDAIFEPKNIHEHSDYYLQTFVYADIVSRQMKARNTQAKVSPALLFIQYAGGEDYDPTLCLGREPVRDIAEVSARFNELLDAKISLPLDVPTLNPSDGKRAATDGIHVGLCGNGYTTDAVLKCR